MKTLSGISRRCLRAFTLIELLLVITIIGILAGLGIPHLKGWGEANTMTSASRQLMDDLAFARLKAISTRSDVYVVFIPPGITNNAFITSLNPDDRPKAINLLPGQFTSYALLQKRQVGDQPGRSFPKYLTPWKSLPDTVFIDTEKFNLVSESVRMAILETNRPFATTNIFPFPTASSPEASFFFPYLQFDSQGRLVSEKDPLSQQYFGASIPLTRGSIFYARDADGKPIIGAADVVETPAGNSDENYNNIRIDWLTGRARLERREIQ